MNWDRVPADEQETVISIDYFERTIDVYTTKQSVGKRLERRLGKPNDIYKIDKKVVGVNYHKKLSDDKMRKILSVSALIGGYRKKIESSGDKNEKSND